MNTLFLIHNRVYLPINKDYEDKSEQKYIGSDINGNVYINMIYTKSELESMYKNNEAFKECANLHDLIKKY